MKNKLIDFIKSFSKLDWVTAFFASGAFWMLLGLIFVLLTPAPEAGAIVMLIGLGMVLIAIPLIFVCSLRRALRKAARQEPTEQPEPEPIPIREPVPAPAPTPPRPAPQPIPYTPPRPAPRAEAATISVPKVSATPRPKVQSAPPKATAPKPKANLIFLMDELNLEHRAALTEAELNGISGMSVAMTRDQNGFSIQKIRSLAGNLDTERYTMPADFFQTANKNDFKIWLFKRSIFRVDVEQLWNDPAFCAMIISQSIEN